MRKKISQRKNTANTRKRKKKSKLKPFLIVIGITIILTLLVSEYIKDFLSKRIEYSTIGYNDSLPNTSPQVEQQNNTTTETNIVTPSLPDTPQKDSNIESTPVEQNIQNNPSNENTSQETMDTQTAQTAQENKTVSISLYFIKIIDDKSFRPVKYTRDAPFTLSVLKASLSQLLLGPSDNEIQNGIRTFISKSSVLHKVYVENNTVFLNFNDAFQFNENGSLGLLAQLFQIVYTCTEYPNIDNVQILINGEKRNYLAGDEGLIPIDTPLTRTILQNHASNIQ